MSLANSVRIQYKGQTLIELDPTLVKAVKPSTNVTYAPMSLWERIKFNLRKFILGEAFQRIKSSEATTKILFKDGTFEKIKMPFLEFMEEYG